MILVAGGVLAGYGAKEVIGNKNALKNPKIGVIGPLLAGLGLLAYGVMEYNKNKTVMAPTPTGVDLPPANGIPVQAVAGSSAGSNYLYDTKSAKVSNSMAGFINPPLVPNNDDLVNWHASGNASPGADYNHIYPGII